ncbi:MAG: Crp/Fnr family transcriptional regulator [Flavipsychrobacter sp.]
MKLLCFRSFQLTIIFGDMIHWLKDQFPQIAKHYTTYAGNFRRKEVPAKTILLREGEVARKLFFIESGCMRIWFNDDGRDITMQFFFEGSCVASYESLRTGQPGLYTLETLEPCIVHEIDKDDFDRMEKEVPAIRDEMEDLIYRRWFYYQKLFLSRIRDTPQQRYKILRAENPHIVDRVPQHYIASYLGITSVSLSRIKNKV